MADVFDRFYLPEDAGISSIAIANFLQDCDKIHYKLRTLHIIRHGKAVVETARYPFRASDKRLVYSVSKTFTSTAIGFAVDEGLVNAADKLLKYFPECEGLDMDPRAREITLRDVLTMSTGHERDTVGDMCNSETTPWPEIFFTRKMAYEPGEHFVYNSGGTYMLSEVISRVTGKSLFQWLQEKLFGPLGITDVSWDTNGKVNTGAWGLLIAPRDLCKVGMLYLNKGLWNGQRLLSEEWIEEASTPYVSTLSQGCAGWGQRYGYQIWENSPGSYRADGAFGQLVMVFPKEDMVIVTTAEEIDGTRVFPLVEQHLLSNLTDPQKGRDAWAYEHLQKVLCQWEAPAVYEPSSSYLQIALQNRTYQLKGISSQEQHTLRIQTFNSRLCIIVDEKQKVESSCVADVHGETEFAIEIPSNSPLRGEEQRSRPWAYSAHHAWVDQDTLLLTVCWRETGHFQTWKFLFGGNHLTLWITDGVKGMFELFGAVSDQNVRFCDMIFEGSLQ